MRILLSLFILASFVFTSSCNKESFTNSPDARIGFSTDSIYFDTIFSSTSSVTKSFKIFNENDQKLNLQQIRLAGGSNSSFRLNINGIPSTEASNIEMGAGDSIYIFVSLKPDQSNQDQPFFLEDSISFQFNGNERWVKLSAWGQDANFKNDYEITEDEVWTNERPYVIIGGLHIPPGKKLTLEEGTKVYFRADAPFIIDGTLEVKGEVYDSTKVVFQSDRLDDPYKGFPGSWPGLTFTNQSTDNLISNAIIKNAYQGIVLNETEVELNQTVIENCYDAGVLSIGSDLSASNLLVSNCGKGVILARGGNHKLIHCTIAGISNNYVLHKEPSLIITDFIRDGNTVYVEDTKVELINSIIWGANGSVENELLINRAGNKSWDILISHNLIKNEMIPEGVNLVQNILNEEPEFEEINSEKRQYNFRLKEISPAIGKGKSTSISYDLEGKPRKPSNPDLGVYERN
ncbi:MAG: hypothetical protein ACXWV4_13580 [Flavitalea sp.]